MRLFLDRLLTFSRRHTFVFPLILLFETILTYGMMGFSSGFYWDDWPAVLISNIHKANIFFTAYFDRPISGWTFTAMFPLLQNYAPAWQLATMLLRWIGVVLMFFTFVELFPQQKTLLKWAGLIAIVLPVFQYQYISVAFSQHFLTFAIFACSLYFLLLSIKFPKYFWLYYPLSLILAAAHVFMMEYFVGLEILRPLVLYLSLRKFAPQKTHRLRKAFLLYIPFAVGLLGYFYWRFVYYPATAQLEEGYSNNALLFSSLLSHPIGTLQSLLSSVIADFRFSFLSSWTDRLWPVDLEFTGKVFWLSVLAGGVGSGVALFFFKEKKEEETILSNKSFWMNIVFGLVIFVFGVAPIWASLRQISKGKFSERFALAALTGIALIITVVIWKLISSARTRNLLLTLIVLASISYQVQVGNDARKDSLEQKNIYSQLYWRIPQLKPSTAVYSPNIFTGDEADYSYSMGINLLFDQNVQPDLKYWFFTPRDYPVTDLLNDPAIQLTGELKGNKFVGTPANMIAVYKNGSGCLLVLDPVYAALAVSPAPANFTSYGDLTNFSQIIDSTASQPAFPQAFGKLSEDDWCYYFEKADLAKQEKNWEKVISLYDDAAQKGLSPLKSVEYIPLITAFAEKGKVDEALTLTQKAVTMGKTVAPSACKLWSLLTGEHPEISSAQISAALGEGTCAP